MTLSSNPTYYGLYTQSVTLTYAANGGASTPSPQSGTRKTNSYAISTYSNPSFTLASAITRTNYVFSAWTVSAPISEDKAAGSTITPTSGTALTATAKWVAANYSVSSPVKYTLTLREAVSAANTSATITVLQTVDDSSSVSINKTLTLALNGKTLSRNKEIYVTAGTFTVSGSGLLTTPNTTTNGVVDDYGILYGTGGTIATSTTGGAPTLISTSVAIYILKNASLDLNGGTIISTNRSAMIINDWGNTATITDTKILGCPGNKGGIIFRHINNKNATIDGSSIVSNGCTASTEGGEGDATTITWISKGKLTITGSTHVTSGSYAGNCVGTNASTLPDNTNTRTGVGSTIEISGSVSMWAFSECMYTKCDKIIINTSGYLCAVGAYAVHNLTALTPANFQLTKGIFVSRSSDHSTIKIGNTVSGVSSQASGSQRTYRCYVKSGNSIITYEYQKSNTYVYKKQ